MPPKASTSAASKKPTGAANGGPAKKTAAAGGSKSSGSKLTPKERQLYDFAMRSENKVSFYLRWFWCSTLRKADLHVRQIITQDMVSAEFEWKVQEFIGELTSLTKKVRPCRMDRVWCSPELQADWDVFRSLRDCWSFGLAQTTKFFGLEYRLLQPKRAFLEVLYI